MSIDVQKWLKDKMKIHNYTTTAEVKAPSVERAIRTLRKAFARYSQYTGSKRWLDFLAEFVVNYNDRFHSVTQQRPLDLVVDPMMMPLNKPKKVSGKKAALPEKGSTVRISVTRSRFQRKKRVLGRKKSFV